jgi:hypothetical protein
MYIENSSSPIAPNPANLSAVDSPGVNATLSVAAAATTADAILPALEKQIVVIEERLHSLKDGSGEDLVEDLLKWGHATRESAAAALTASQHAIVYAWATGRVFNLAKEKIGHGQFGKWRDSMASETGISVRSVQNWMKLAGKCSDVRALLVTGGNLVGAYRAAGVLPKPPEPPGKEDNDDDNNVIPTPPVIEKVFTSLANGRKSLRQLDQAGAVLGKEDRDRLILEKSAYLELFEKLLSLPTL